MIDSTGALAAIILLISLAMAHAYSPTLDAYQQGLPMDRIVGGVVVPEDEKNKLQWIVSLRDDSGFHFCGGTLIREDVILTAAHCVKKKEDLSWYDTTLPLVSIGPSDLETAGGNELVKPVLSVVHGAYDEFTIQADIALLFLDRAVGKERGISPISLGTQDTLDQLASRGQTATVSVYGWGLLSESEFLPSNELRKTAVTYYDAESCRSLSEYPPNDIRDDMICAGDIEEGGTDACGGDSGGGLFYEDTSVTSQQSVQVGIVSWGDGCAKPGYPGVYTSVPAFMPWIEWQINIVDTLKKDLSCFPESSFAVDPTEPCAIESTPLSTEEFPMSIYYVPETCDFVRETCAELSRQMYPF